ncbi:RTA1 domain-containing protein [Rutstroemia sp. NJR-2017a BBW]|nr:RTA1 domain-containing protein [Rutstroemia sp. NJR-2017a BBW]
MAVSTVSTVCSSEDVCGSLSFFAALGLTIIFGALMVVHTGQAIYYGKPWIYHFRTSTLWALLYPLWASTAWTFLSFLNLTASYFDPHPLLLLFSRNFLLISPLWFTTYLHLLLPHLTNYFLPTRALLSLRAPVLRAVSLLFTIPVAGLQVVGVLSGVGNHGSGRVLFASGVILQGVGILIFIFMLCVLDREIRQLENGEVLDERKKRWRRGNKGETNNSPKDHPPIPSHSPLRSAYNAKQTPHLYTRSNPATSCNPFLERAAPGTDIGGGGENGEFVGEGV